MRGSIRIKHTFGENVVAIVERSVHDLEKENFSVDMVCRRILTKELSDDEVVHMSKLYARMGRIEQKIRNLSPPILTERDRQGLMFGYYLAENLSSFEDVLDGWRRVVQKAHEAECVEDDLLESSLKSIEVVRKVARLYVNHWESRRESELTLLAEGLQRAIDALHDPIDRVESVLRGNIGLREVEYYIVDNKYPNCSARRWGGKRWIVGWSDPLEVATPEVVIQVISDEASHWILENPFTEEKRCELAELLRESLDESGSHLLADWPDPDRVLLEGVDGASTALSEGYGHAFIGFPWTGDETPIELPKPRRRGEEGTLYAESYRFTKWFHEHWREFLENPSVDARDWAWQCVEVNISKFIEIARKFLERGTIYEYEVN